SRTRVTAQVLALDGRDGAKYCPGQALLATRKSVGLLDEVLSASNVSALVDTQRALLEEQRRALEFLRTLSERSTPSGSGGGS
ncbi:MAG: hypothetical protein ACTHMX_15180, partial [Thermomicrobiales bacterium]